MLDTRNRLEYAYNRFLSAVSEADCVRRMTEDGSVDRDLPKRTKAALAELKGSREQVTRYMEQLEKETAKLDNNDVTGQV
jgi:hypothetical protein